MVDKNISWETDGSLGILTIANPPENYLIEPEFVSIEQLKSWLTEDIKGLIITGAGRHFSGGADLKNLMELAKNETDLFQSMQKGNHLLNYIDDRITEYHLISFTELSAFSAFNFTIDLHHARVQHHSRRCRITVQVQVHTL